MLVLSFEPASLVRHYPHHRSLGSFRVGGPVAALVIGSSERPRSGEETYAVLPRRKRSNQDVMQVFNVVDGRLTIADRF